MVDADGRYGCVPVRPFAVDTVTGELPPAPVSTINDFIPEDRDMTECISAVPKPGCGSDARSGWEQGALFGVLIAAMVFIAWRVVRSARRKPSSELAPTSGAQGPQRGADS